ncbi:energy transducer TonB [Sphingomonas colocasiae]|uniref:Energy transducer TonB n=1 Tax=Sphingomonas colocasiae TaxID=1848973 RepID=A0ABS7PW82_9SPHN|nr:energy transducer TonB [Sphingomonas colocasiae]MBY8825214.1 energy transducer TonB [Sphingomonas colocasiae]
MKLPDPWDIRTPPVRGAAPVARYGDRDVRGVRAKGLALTLLLHGCALAGLLVQLHRHSPPPPQSLLTVNLLPLAAPPDPVRDVKEGPEQVEQPRQRAAPQKPATPPVTPVPAAQPAKPAEPIEAAARPPVPETTAPRSLPAPPAPAVSSNMRDSWEARLLAHLERHRRFPADARARREEGVAHIRFRMNRAGRVLAARILRGSASPSLDRAALETVRRAQPLPAIPEALPEEIELDLPVAFFLR